MRSPRRRRRRRRPPRTLCWIAPPPGTRIDVHHRHVVDQHLAHCGSPPMRHRSSAPIHHSSPQCALGDTVPTRSTVAPRSPSTPTMVSVRRHHEAHWIRSSSGAMGAEACKLTSPRSMSSATGRSRRRRRAPPR
jgi:hypothetical protein